MENVVDALYMGVAVLMLIVALSVSISSFTNLKTQMEEIITADDTVDLVKATNADGNLEYLNYISSSDDVRVVGANTVISSIRRVQTESYTIYLFFNNTTDTGNLVDAIKKITKKENFIEEIKGVNQKYLSINGRTEDDIITDGMTGIRIFLQAKIGQELNNSIMEKIYAEIRDKKFKEYQGIYQNNNEEVSSANKETYRIITYVQYEESTESE